jgi:hypothetical protein
MIQLSLLIKLGGVVVNEVAVYVTDGPSSISGVSNNFVLAIASVPILQYALLTGCKAAEA